MSKMPPDQASAARRIIVANESNKGKNKITEAKFSLQPDVQTLLNDALTVVAAEIIKLRQKSSKELRPLDLAESRVLQGYVKSLVELSRENRERDDERDLSNMTDAELLSLAQKLVKPKEEPKDE